MAPQLVGPLVAVIWNRNGWLVAPDAVGALVMTGTPTAMVMVSGWVVVAVALVALIVPLNVPFDVGVPEMSPVPVFNVTPGGRLDAAYSVGLFVATIW